MFESDDWDLDQDFLNDIDDKATKYCSQKDKEPCEPKRRRIENEDNSPSHCNANPWEERTANETVLKRDKSKESRKNLVLGLFNKNLPDKSISNDAKRSCNNILSNSCTNHVRSCENSQLPRKNLVLEILKKKNTQDTIIENNVKNTDAQSSGKEMKSNGNISTNKECSMVSDRISNKIPRTNSELGSNSKQISHENSRKKLLCNILKQQTTSNTDSENDSSKNKPPMIKPAPAQPSKKMTLVRKFPGPAGLLPDDIDANFPCESYLNTLEESEMTKKEPDSNNLTEYCSQTTKNLFSEGAWQLMLDDLPTGFLKGYDIATVKQTATLNGFNGTKVQFLAGIIEHIDFSHDNPPIVLKDFTDSIQGIVHSDIPLKYPGLLEANVVVLLHDVGLLRISGTFVSNKYQILIPPSSLLAIYTSKGVVQRTEHMESVFKDISKGKSKTEEKLKGDSISAKLSKAHSSKNGFLFNETTSNNSKKLESSKTNKKDTNFSTSLNDTNAVINESLDFDTDISFSASPTKVTDPRNKNKKNLNNSVSKKSKRIKEENEKRNSKQFAVKEERPVQNKDKEKSEDLLKSLKRFAPHAKQKIQFAHNSKISRLDAEHSESINTCSKEDESELLNDEFFEKMDLDKCEADFSSEKIKPKIESSSPFTHKNREPKQEKNTATIRSKLRQFKSADVLTPPEISTTEKDEELPEKKLPETSDSMRDILGDTENDSDDEMLSQLDMDTIFSNYNKTS